MSVLTNLLEGIAPTVASALLGPLGGIAITGLGKILGLDSATTSDITKMVTEGKVSPEQLAEIKKMELQFQNDEKERGFRYAEIEFQNTQSAREMQISTQSSTPTVMSYLITLGFFGILTYMLSDAYVSSEPLLVMLGSLGTAWVAVVNFWFGSSHGSMQKSEILANTEKRRTP